MTLLKQAEIGQWVEQEEHLVASKLFHLRSKMNVERSQLAEALDIEEYELANYENGIEPVPATTLFLISTYLGVNVKYFFTEEVDVYTANTALANDDEEAAPVS